MSDFVTLLLTTIAVVAVGFSLTLLGAWVVVWWANLMDRWLD